MGLFTGLLLIGLAAVPDIANNAKWERRNKSDEILYGKSNMDAYDMVRAVMYGHPYHNEDTPPVWGQELNALTRQYRAEHRPKAFECAAHDLAKRECEKRGIPFTGRYVNTFHLPG